MSTDRTRLAPLACLLLLVTGGQAVAQSTPPGLRDLVGARAGQAEGELQRRGYQAVRTETGDDRKWTFWYSQTYGRCVTIATVNGRYDSIIETPVPDCQRGGQATTLPGGPGYSPPVYDQRPSYGGGVQVGGRPLDLALVCYGDGRKPGLANQSGYVWNPRRERYEYTNQLVNREEHFDAQLTLQLWNGGGRIRLPRSLVPPLNRGGANGWWPLRDVDVRRNRVTASYRLNGLNRPQITFDRRSGRVTIVGYANYGFRGTCDTI